MLNCCHDVGKHCPRPYAKLSFIVTSIIISMMWLSSYCWVCHCLISVFIFAWPWRTCRPLFVCSVSPWRWFITIMTIIITASFRSSLASSPAKKYQKHHQHQNLHQYRVLRSLLARTGKVRFKDHKATISSLPKGVLFHDYHAYKVSAARSSHHLRDVA